jgi:hypothetical protein
MRHPSAEVSAVDVRSEEDDQSRSTTLFIVILSLLFVAVFGGALVGGVVSGDPTNGFFITIIAASAVAISVALLVSLRYYCKNRSSNTEEDGRFNKDLRATFSNSDEENLHGEMKYYEGRRGQYHHHHGRTPVQARIKEIQATSVVGEMSALSPHSYDVESLSTRRDLIREKNQIPRKGLFDFASVASAKQSPSVQQVREDPPEGAGPATYHAAWIVRGHSQDPAAPKVTADGEIVSDEEEEAGIDSEADESHSISSRQSGRSRYDVDEEETEDEDENNTSGELVSENEDPENPLLESEDSARRTSRRHGRRRRSRSKSRSRSRSTSRSKSPFRASSKQNEKEEVSQKSMFSYLNGFDLYRLQSSKLMSLLFLEEKQIKERKGSTTPNQHKIFCR